MLTFSCRPGRLITDHYEVLGDSADFDTINVWLLVSNLVIYGF